MNVIRRAFIDAIGTFLYVVVIVLFIQILGKNMPREDSFFIPIAMLLLFVFSAAFVGFLVFGKPVMLYLDGRKREAVSMIGYTLGFLLVFVLMSFIFLIGFSFI